MYQITYNEKPFGTGGLYGDMVEKMTQIRKSFGTHTRVESIGKPHYEHVKIHGIGVFKIVKTGVDIMALVTSGRS